MKNTLKKWLVPVLASRPIAALAMRLLGSGIPVFMLHRITLDENTQTGAVTSEYLRRCLTYLAENRYTFISLEQLLVALMNNDRLPPRPVVFTMDDGYVDQAEIAAPIFREFDCPLTFFVVTGMLDQALWPWDAKIAWLTQTTRQPALNLDLGGKPVVVSLGANDDRRQAKRALLDMLRSIPAVEVPDAIRQLEVAAEVRIPEDPPAAYRPMDWNMARILERRGVRFAPHSVSHNILSRLDPESLQHEIEDAWNRLQAELQHPLKVFCYPNGRQNDFGQREIALLKNLGFLGAVSTTPEPVQPRRNHPQQLFNLPRLGLPGSMEDFIQYCTWIEYFKGGKPLSAAKQ